MYFDNLELVNFGPFREFKIAFSPSGINLITGDNGVGKSQILGAIVFALIGKSAIRVYPDGEIPSKVTLTIREDTNFEVITRTLQEGDPKLHLKRVVNTPSRGSKRITLSKQLIPILKNPIGPKLLLSSTTRDDVSITPEEFNYLSEFNWKNQETNYYWNEFRNNIGIYRSDHKFMSEGQRKLIQYAKEFIVRQNITFPIPLCIDDNFSKIDMGGLKGVVGELFESIATHSQVIILTNLNNLDGFFRVDIKTREVLQQPSISSVSALSSNYFPLNNKPAREKRTKKFVLGKSMQVEENRNYEFKEVKGNNAVRSIVDVVDQYAVAYLNEGTISTGIIYWGVRNDDRVIIGVRLNYSERDELRRLVVEKLHQINPEVAPSGYEIKLYPLSSLKKQNSDLYLIEVKISSYPSELLYATGKDEVYIKTDAGKKKLSSVEIQREILKRHSKSQ